MGLFSLHSLHYHGLGAKIPPMLPVPGDDTPHKHQLLRFRLMSYRSPSYIGNTFKALCKFWTIFQKMTLAYYSPTTIFQPVGNLEFAEAIYLQLLDWSESSIPTVTSDTQKSHHDLLLR